MNMTKKEIEKLKEVLNENQNTEASLTNNNNMFKGLLTDAKAENDKLVVTISKNTDEISDLKFKLSDADNKMNELKLVNSE
jgi:sugar-specific transcriptional regulator TrmB